MPENAAASLELRAFKSSRLVALPKLRELTASSNDKLSAL